VPFGSYARSWVAERPNLRSKTLQLYEGLVRLHLAPTLGALNVQDITEPQVRRWRKNLLDARTGEVTVAKAYRLLKAILTTAVDDGLIRRNPCRIKGAGQERSPERPVLTIRQVFALADAIGPRYRALVLLAVFGSLRWGELAALRRRHLDLRTGTVRVEASVVELIDGSLIFTGPKGAPLRRPNFSATWRRPTESAGLTGFHFHDLRHTGNHIAAATGASLRELMGRMGHSTTRAALVYQHRTDERDQLIAAMSQLVTAELHGSGTQPAREDAPDDGPAELAK
jgi:integrase